MTKKQLRTLYKQKRLALPENERSKLDDLLLIQFQQLYIEDVVTVLSYWPMQHMAEVNTHLMTDFLQFRMPGMQLAYTKINNQTQQLEAFAVNDDTDFVLNSFGVAEPVSEEIINPLDIDLVITPLLVCDESGYRVGYGKGYYDKFLAQCRPDVLKIGFSYFDIIPSIDDVDDFDVSLSICITPHQVYEF